MKSNVFSIALAAFYPILVIVEANINEIIFVDIIIPVLSSIILSYGVYFVFKKITSDSQKSFLLTIIFIIFFFYYGFFYNNFFAGIHIGEVTVGRHRFFLPIWVSTFFLLFFLILKHGKNITKFLSFFKYLLVFLTTYLVISISVNSYSISDNTNTRKNHSLANKNNLPSSDPEKPDIYYIIFDGYASKSTLKDIYGFDNSTFLNQLSDIGFDINNNSFANHSYTYLSLSSSLNMIYMNWLGEDNSNTNTRKIGETIGENKVAKILKNYGYKYVTFDSGYSTSSKSKIADRKVSCATFSEFDRAIIKNSILDPFFLYGGVRNLVLCQFNELINIAKEKNLSPKFVFTHIVSPHPPFVFKKDGSNASINNGLNPWSDRRAYVEQLQFINKRIVETIKEIIKNSESMPIIILQSDHGPASSGTEEMLNPSDELLKERMKILYAVYGPSGVKSNLARNNSPVNIFRIILSELFGEKFEILDNRSFFTPIGQEKITFEDITNKIKN